MVGRGAGPARVTSTPAGASAGWFRATWQPLKQAAAPTRQDRALRGEIGMIRGWLTGRRGHIHVRRWVPCVPPAAVLMLLHGLGEHSGQYAPLAEAAAEAGVETWALDQAGHGFSDGERMLVERIDDLVADAETLLGRITGARPRVPVVVAGHRSGQRWRRCWSGRSAQGRSARESGPRLGPPTPPPISRAWFSLVPRCSTERGGSPRSPGPAGTRPSCARTPPSWCASPSRPDGCGRTHCRGTAGCGPRRMRRSPRPPHAPARWSPTGHSITSPC